MNNTGSANKMWVINNTNVCPHGNKWNVSVSKNIGSNAFGTRSKRPSSEANEVQDTARHRSLALVQASPVFVALGKKSGLMGLFTKEK